MTFDLAEVKEGLRQGLSAAEGFAREPDLQTSPWAEIFAKAGRALAAPDTESPFPSDLLPAEGYNEEARRILSAAAQAYVFGGMGSWNDMGFAEPQRQERYEDVTATLYAAVKIATVAVPNAFSARPVA